MKPTKKEIEEELNHKKAIVNVLKTRLRPMELQAAQKGINTPPEIITEIGTIVEQIRAQLDEIANLETIAAEGQLSLAEAEYKLLLAEVWDTPVGHPTIGGSAKLELARLRLGLSLERAQELEQLVRNALVEEIFQVLDLSPFLTGGGRNTASYMEGTSATVTIHAAENSQIGFDSIILNQQFMVNSVDSVARTIGKAIRLNAQVALDLCLQCIPPDSDLDLFVFERQLLDKNRVWINQDEAAAFDYFTKAMADHLKVRLLPAP